MILGDGDIASVLTPVDREDRIYFASGVSNSQEIRESEYQREADLLLKQEKRKKLIYFSSLCIFYSNNRYAAHKKYMEGLVKDNFPNYTIVRLGNIIWGDNPNTIINFFKKKIEKGNKINIQDAYRYLVDKDELLHWLKMIPEWNCEMNITGRRMKAAEIAESIRKGLL